MNTAKLIVRPCRNVLRRFVTCTLIFSAAVCIITQSACGAYIRMRVKFYITYCFAPLASAPPQTLLDAVRSGGYAGYALLYEGDYYVVAACMPTTGAALDLAQSLTDRGVESGVLTAQRINFMLETYSAEKNARGYEAVLSALDGLIDDLFSCLDILSREGQGSAREILRGANLTLSELYSENQSNCFTRHLANLVGLSAQCSYGIIYAREVRYFAAAVADCVLSVRLS